MTGRGQATAFWPLAIVALIYGLVQALAPFWAGALRLAQHEGDALHLADLVLRMGEHGQLPHLDFLTPLGIGGLWPIAIFVKAGLGFGHAFMAGQALVAALLFYPALRAGQSRFPGALAWLFVAYVLGLCLALVHGEARTGTSLSMHYNRWAWALAYIALPLAMLEPLDVRRRPWLDGGLIGLMLSGMALIKVTYFLAFAPVIVVALLVRRDFKALGVAVLAGLAVVVVLTLILGVPFWLAYAKDLILVAGSEIRSAPGDSFGEILGAPAHIAGTLLLLATVIFLRQAGEMSAGLLLLLLTPAFAYVTYQNFGNDPQWLVFLGLVALALRPDGMMTNGLGWRLRDAVLVAGAGALILGAGSAINLVISPVRHVFSEAEGRVPLLSARPHDDDVQILSPRLYAAKQTVRMDGAGQPFERFAELGKGAVEGEKPQKDAVLNGEILPDCEMASFNALFEQEVSELVAAGYAGQSILSADLFTALWLYGPIAPVKGAAPWYYGGAPGLSHADHLLVPLCPSNKVTRAQMLSAINEGGWTLVEELRTPTFVLLKPEAP
ncbi:hypothetical protein SAMN05877809_10826 [Rhodobacter sp. JA431]|uniref:hypothetical protein n=1 Tax=Rhodobacter sp. JA431 TaxID=570013 RepID=UPI000BD46FFC|nr:hypothetical protein [Rhodobacter sp. JA431]SOC15593.1 hypothetical protein SAMN05877809_10826 [Rhodobacter sp. JA431]